MCACGFASIWLRMAFVVPGTTRNVPNLTAENTATTVRATPAIATRRIVRGNSPTRLFLLSGDPPSAVDSVGSGTKDRQSADSGRWIARQQKEACWAIA